MKRLLAAVFLLCASAFAGTCGNSYTYSIKFTVPASHVPNTDQTNFPVTLSFNGAHYYNSYTLLDLKTVANGGKIQNTAANSKSVTGPADLIFCDAVSAGNTLKFEVSQYTATTGAMEAHVSIPTLSHTTNNTFYMFYGNAAVVTSQQDLTLWTGAGYTGVFHLSDGTTLNVADFSGTTIGVNHGATATTGAIDGAAAVVSGSSQYIDTGGAHDSASFTYEAWVNPTSFAANMPLIDNISGGNGEGFLMGQGAGNGVIGLVTVSGGASFECIFSSTAVASTGAWSALAVSKTGSGSAGVKLYNNGVVQTNNSTCSSLAQVNGGSNTRIGSEAGASSFANATFDEVRFSNSVRSADWLASTYGTQSSPSEFAFTSNQTSGTGARISQYATCNSAISTTNTCTLPVNVTSGNLLIVVSADSDSSKCNIGNINTLFTDTRGSTFTYALLADNLAGGLPNSCIAFATLGSSGAESITASAAASSSQSMMIYEIASVTSASLDVTVSNTGGASSTLSTGSATATTASSILICGFGGSSSGTQFYTSSMSPSGGSSLLNTSSASVGGATKGGTAFIQFTGSGSKTCTFTFGGPGPTNTAGAMAVLKYSPVSVASKRRQSQIY